MLRVRTHDLADISIATCEDYQASENWQLAQDVVQIISRV